MADLGSFTSPGQARKVSPGGVRRRSGELETAQTIKERAKRKRLEEKLGGKIETVGGKQVLIKVKKPDVFEAVDPRGKVVARGTRLDIVKIISERERATAAGRALLARKPEKDVIQLDQPVQKFTGSIRAADISKLEQIERKLKGVSEKSPGTFKAIAAGTIGLGAVGAVKGLVGVKEAIFNPIDFLKSQALFAKELVTSPVKTVRILSEEFFVNPVGTVAEYATFAKGLGTTAKFTKQSPVGRFVLEESFIRSQPKELQGAVRAIIKSSKVQEKINPKNIKSIKNVDFAEVKSLKPFEGIALKKALQETDSVVFGSLAGRTLSGKKTPLPKDVDLATADIAKFNKAFIDNLPPKIRSNYKLKGEKVIRVSDGEVLFDIKPLERLIPGRSIITRRGTLPLIGKGIIFSKKPGSVLPTFKKGLKFAKLEIPTQKLVKVEGIKLTGFGEQTTRKGLGTLQVLLEKNVRRAKDPQSFITSLQVQIESLKGRKPKTTIGKLRLKSQIKSLENALKILRSKSFAKLLDSKVPQLTKEFPILTKIDVKKLRKAKPLPKKEVIKKLTKEIKKKSTIKKSVTDIKRKKALKKKPSKIPSKLKKKPSRLSRIPKKKPSKIVSKTPRKKKPSKIPIKKVSRIPKKKPSKILVKPASKVVSRVPSKTRAKRSSVLRARKLRALTPTKRKFFVKLRKSKLLRNKISKISSDIPNKFMPTLEAIFFDITANKKPQSITGLEVRPIIIKLARRKGFKGGKSGKGKVRKK